MTDRKLEIKRLIIYLLFAFGIAWCIFIAFSLTDYKWDGSNQRLESLVGLGMLAPLIAHVLTRLITKEGFAMTGKGSMLFGISFKNKKWKYFIFAMFVPWVYFEVTNIIALVLVPEAFDTGILGEMGLSNEIAFVYPLIIISSCTIASFAALGEEGGWRGYMMPKLMKLMSVPKAVIVGGIIWGVWHAPLTCIGHNFGTDYPGFPYVGILVMCIFCTLMGMLLTYITIKSSSIWPAAIMHAVNNGNPTILRFFLNEEIFADKYPNRLFFYILLLSVMAAIDLIIIVREKKKTK